MMSKDDLRRDFRKTRAAIPLKRRIAASEALSKLVMEKCTRGLVLSFASIKDEIDTTALNERLIKSNRLALPVIRGNALHIYRVGSMHDLIPGQMGILEPNPDQSVPINIEEIDWILVPAIAFDRQGYRIGYGKGYYDRLLYLSNASTFGVGFREQLTKSPLPIDPWDRAVSELLLA